MSTFYLMAWLLPSAIILHIVEEFLFPGGFILWYQQYRPQIASSITPKRLLIINVVLIIVSFFPLFFGSTSMGRSWLLCILSILSVNAVFHLVGSFQTKSYSPGLVTSLIIYLPLSIYTNWWLLHTQVINWSYALQCFFVGIAYHVWSAYSHKKRAERLDALKSINS